MEGKVKEVLAPAPTLVVDSRKTGAMYIRKNMRGACKAMQNFNFTLYIYTYIYLIYIYVYYKQGLGNVQRLFYFIEKE